MTTTQLNLRPMTVTPSSPLPLFDLRTPTKTPGTEHQLTPSYFFRKQEKGKTTSPKKGPVLPVTSIAADFDLVAKEEARSQCENDNPFSQQQNQETMMKQIDAMMTAGDDGDHEDDTDLGFDFANSPARNDDCLSSIHKGSPASPSVETKGRFHLESETPSNRATNSEDSFPLPSPPKQSFFRQQMNQGHRTMPVQGPPRAPNTGTQFGHTYDHFPSRSYHNHPGMSSNMHPPPYGQKMMFYPTGPRHQPTTDENNAKFQSQPHQHSKHGPTRQSQQYIQLATPNHHSRMNNRLGAVGKSDQVMKLSPWSGDKKSDDDKANLKTKSILRSPPMKKRKVVGDWDESSRKKDIDVVPIGTPNHVFSSPKGYKRSPLLTNTSMSFGGSFDMDSSPNHKLDDMFQSSATFEIGENSDMITSNSNSQKDSHQGKMHTSNSLMFDTVLSPFRTSPVYKTGVDRNVMDSSLDIFKTFEASPLPPPKQSPKKTFPLCNSGIMKFSEPSPLPKKQNVDRGNIARRPPKKNNLTFASPGSYPIKVCFFFL